MGRPHGIYRWCTNVRSRIGIWKVKFYGIYRGRPWQGRQTRANALLCLGPNCRLLIGYILTVTRPIESLYRQKCAMNVDYENYKSPIFIFIAYFVNNHKIVNRHLDTRGIIKSIHLFFILVLD